MVATGIKPQSLETILADLPSTIQERWFARLYLAKALVLASLVTFWIASGTIALTVAFESATAILTSHGMTPGFGRALNLVTSLADIGVGIAIGYRRTCQIGLAGGICLSLLYMIAAGLIAPDLWVEPLGSLVKTFPAIILMLVALAIVDDR